MISAITGREHWDKVYRTKAEDEVSWFEAIPDTSIRLIENAQLPKTAPIIDVGGGLSRLADGKLGPERCSGLSVRRDDQDDLVTLLGEGFQLVEARNLDHRTPAGAIQRFFAAHFVRRCNDSPEASDAAS